MKRLFYIDTVLRKDSISIKILFNLIKNKKSFYLKVYYIVVVLTPGYMDSKRKLEPSFTIVFKSEDVNFKPS